MIGKSKDHEVKYQVISRNNQIFNVSQAVIGSVHDLEILKQTGS